MHPDGKLGVENEDEVNHDDVNDDVVVDDVVDVQFHVEREVLMMKTVNFSKMFTMWLVVTSFIYIVGSRQSGMYLTPGAAHRCGPFCIKAMKFEKPM